MQMCTWFSHMHSHISISVYIHTFSNTHTRDQHVHIYVHTHTNIYWYWLDTYTRTHIHTCHIHIQQVNSLENVHIQSYVCIRIYLYILMCMHTFISTPGQLAWKCACHRLDKQERPDWPCSVEAWTIRGMYTYMHVYVYIYIYI